MLTQDQIIGMATEAAEAAHDQVPGIQSHQKWVVQFAELIAKEAVVDFYRNFLDTTVERDITEQAQDYVRSRLGSDYS